MKDFVSIVTIKSVDEYDNLPTAIWCYTREISLYSTQSSISLHGFEIEAKRIFQ